jgi:hypothetical protein
VYSYEPFVPTPVDFAIVDPAQLATLKFDGIFSNNVLEHFPPSGASDSCPRSSRRAHPSWRMPRLATTTTFTSHAFTCISSPAVRWGYSLRALDCSPSMRIGTRWSTVRTFVTSFDVSPDSLWRARPCVPRESALAGA